MSNPWRSPLFPALCACACLLGAVRGAAQEGGRTGAEGTPPPSPAPARYVIRVSLDANQWRLEGEEQVTVKNMTGRPLERLCFRLGPNTAAHPQGGPAVPEEGLRSLGYMEVHAVRLANGTALPAPPSIREARMTVPLARPLAPGGSLTLVIPFSVKLPHAPPWRWGVCGAGVTALDWYPKACLEEPAGEGRTPEAGFGDYEVTLTLDTRFTVEATGTLAERHDEGGRRIARYRAERVRDFAWCADPCFRAAKNVYRGVEIVILGQPFSADAEEALLDRAKAVIDRFRTELVPYPYPRLVVAVAPYGARNSAHGSMVLRIPLGHPLHVDCLRRARTLERALAAEAARHYFLALFAPRDEETTSLHRGLAAWFTLHDKGAAGGTAEGVIPRLEGRIVWHLLDEGFGLYAGGTAGRRGPGGGICAPLLQPLEMRLNLTTLAGYSESPFLPEGTSSLFGYRLAWEGLPDGGARRIAALRARFLGMDDGGPAGRAARREAEAALALFTLERFMGREKMNALVRAYVERFRFQRPGLEDFFSLVKTRGGGTEAVRLAERLLRDHLRVDFAVESVTNARISPEVGFRLQETPGQDIVESVPRPDAGSRGKRSPFHELLRRGVEDEKEGAPGTEEAPGAGEWRWTVRLRSRTDTALPVTVALHFEGGAVEQRTWNGEGGTLLLSGTSPRPLAWAEVDPEGIYAVDRDLLNNRRSAGWKPRGVVLLCTWMQYWLQNYLDGWAFFD